MNEELIMDARIIKTKRNTLNALKRLLKRKKFADISVKDICIEGNVSRGTFYLHYKDKYDLVYKYQIEIMKKNSTHTGKRKLFIFRRVFCKSYSFLEQ